MTAPLPPASLAGAKLDRYYHACAFVNSRAEAYETLTPFIKEGVDGGEKVVQVTDPHLRQDHLRLLADAGIDVDDTQERGQLEVITWAETYLRGGRFDPEAMMALLEAMLLAAQKRGFPRTRLVGHMEWALEDRPGVENLLEYEARVNHVLASHRQPAVCTYDVTRFPGHIMLDVLRTHPLVVVNGVLQENPFFVPPDEFLRELRARRPAA
jgi:hypothetical protein